MRSVEDRLQETLDKSTKQMTKCIGDSVMLGFYYGIASSLFILKVDNNQKYNKFLKDLIDNTIIREDELPEIFDLVKEIEVTCEVR